MRFFVTATILSLYVAIASASPMPQPPPAAVYIESATYAGTGCNAGSVAISYSDDFTFFTVAFGNYVASIGPGTAFSDRRKNCNLNFKLHYPVGLQVTLYETGYIGSAELGSGVTATRQSQYWFAGFADQRATFQTTWPGPYSNHYNFTNTLIDEDMVWPPCGASTTLNINTQLFLETSSPQASGFVTNDVVDQKTTTLSLLWRPCT